MLVEPEPTTARKRIPAEEPESVWELVDRLVLLARIRDWLGGFPPESVTRTPPREEGV
jgi:hypothetical protein